MITKKDPKETILDELKKGHKAIRETIRLYNLLEEIDLTIVGHSREMGDMYKVVKTICKKRDDGGVTKKGKLFYWNK